MIFGANWVLSDTRNTSISLNQDGHLVTEQLQLPPHKLSAEDKIMVLHPQLCWGATESVWAKAKQPRYFGGAYINLCPNFSGVDRHNEDALPYHKGPPKPSWEGHA